MSQKVFEGNFPLPTLQDKKVIFNEFVKLRKDELLRSDGKNYRYYVLEVPGPAALILARVPDGRFVITKEYRHPAGQVLLSLPGGYVDQGEDPIEAAKRELLEESGYAAENYAIMGSSYPYAGISSQSIYYIYSENAKYAQQPNLEISEHIQVFLMSEEELKKLIKQGHPVDGNLLTALYWLSIMPQ